MSLSEELQAAEARAAKAEARASEAESNMMTAANYGKQLLEQLQESERIRAELEQEKHSLKLNLQNVEASEKSYQDEIQGNIVDLCDKRILVHFYSFAYLAISLSLLTLIKFFEGFQHLEFWNQSVWSNYSILSSCQFKIRSLWIFSDLSTLKVIRRFCS